MAKSIKQQAAIAMSMKKAGKKPKSQGQKDVKKFKTGGKVKKLKKFNVGGVNDCPPGMFKDAFGNCVSRVDAAASRVSSAVNNRKLIESLNESMRLKNEALNKIVEEKYRQNPSGRNIEPIYPDTISAERIRKLIEKNFGPKNSNVNELYPEMKNYPLQKKGGSTYKKGGAVKKSIKSKKK